MNFSWFITLFTEWCQKQDKTFTSLQTVRAFFPLLYGKVLECSLTIDVLWRKLLKSLVSKFCSHIFPVEWTFLCLFTQNSISFSFGPLTARKNELLECIQNRATKLVKELEKKI